MDALEQHELLRIQMLLKLLVVVGLADVGGPGEPDHGPISVGRHQLAGGHLQLDGSGQTVGHAHERLDREAETVCGRLRGGHLRQQYYQEEQHFPRIPDGARTADAVI